MAGKFIVFEGLDGSGKTVQANLLADFLLKKGKRIILTNEPTNDSPFAKKIRQILKGEQKMALNKLQEFFAKDREWHLSNVILPGIKEGKIVISNRYLFSSFAFGMASGVPYSYIYKLNKDFIDPDIVFFLDVPAKICLQRIEKRGEEKELFENIKKLRKAYINYRSVLNDYRNRSKIYFINGKRPIKTIFQEIVSKGNF